MINKTTNKTTGKTKKSDVQTDVQAKAQVEARVKEVVAKANAMFNLMLKAAYDYYWKDDSNMSDYEYDALTRHVFGLRNSISDPRKILVDWDALKTCSSLYYIKKKDYGQDCEDAE